MMEIDTINRMRDGHLVSHYLLASYAYYVLDESPMTDQAYDRLCERLYERFDGINHPHLKLISKDSLTAGTGFYLNRTDYPQIIQDCIYDYLADCRNGRIAEKLEPHLLPAGPTAARAPRVSRRTPPSQESPPVRTVTRVVRRTPPPAPAAPAVVKRVSRRK